MSAANTSEAVSRRVKSIPVPRKPQKVKAGDDFVRVTLLLPADDVRAIDDEAERRSGEDQYGRTITRSDVIRSMINESLRPKK
jgi:hypothetical protein